MLGLSIGKLGNGATHVVEIDAVVPHEDIVRQGCPPLHRFDELAARRIVRKGHFAVAVDVAQHDIDIGQRLHVLRGLHRKEVGQRRKLLVGETLRQLVQEADIVARKRAFVRLTFSHSSQRQ